MSLEDSYVVCFPFISLLNENHCLNEIWNKFKSGTYWEEKKITDHMIKRERGAGHIFSSLGQDNSLFRLCIPKSRNHMYGLYWQLLNQIIDHLIVTVYLRQRGVPWTLDVFLFNRVRPCTVDLDTHVQLNVYISRFRETKQVNSVVL